MSPPEQLTLVMAHMHHGIVMFDADEKIVLINRHVSAIFGFAEAAVTIGSTLPDYLDHVGRAVGWASDRVASVLDNHRAWARQGEAKRFDHHFDDGRIFEICFSPIEQGGAVLTFADVTQDRHLHAVADRRGTLIRETGVMLEKVSRIQSQNRMVALNASIEAARMGDQGASFAVVAEEVRDLCRQTSDVLGEMNEIIHATVNTI